MVVASSNLPPFLKIAVGDTFVAPQAQSVITRNGADFIVYRVVGSNGSEMTLRSDITPPADFTMAEGFSHPQLETFADAISEGFTGFTWTEARQYLDDL